MRRLALFAGITLCLVSPLAGCVTGPSSPKSPTPLERATSAYARVRAAAVTAEPFLPTEVAAHVCASIAIGDEALATAHVQTGSEEQLQAIAKLATTVATIVQAVARR